MSNIFMVQAQLCVPCSSHANQRLESESRCTVKCDQTHNRLVYASQRGNQASESTTMLLTQTHSACQFTQLRPKLFHHRAAQIVVWWELISAGSK
eukprot:m.19564 g.19564  ORF g.19564 m.19564 type:complete len:95 (-) comp8051_c0_seq2:383-667(-)